MSRPPRRVSAAEQWRIGAERRQAARLAARTPEEVAADEMRSAKHLADLASQVTRIPMGDGEVIKGEPHVLKEICRMFGFHNECRDGGVFLTARKIRILFAAPRCVLCCEVMPLNDRLPRGEGNAHAACVLAAEVDRRSTDFSEARVFSQAVALLMPTDGGGR